MDLITELKRAKMGSRGFDVEVESAIRPKDETIVQFSNRAMKMGVPAYTTNLQDALELVSRFFDGSTAHVLFTAALAEAWRLYGDYWDRHLARLLTIAVLEARVGEG